MRVCKKFTLETNFPSMLILGENATLNEASDQNDELVEGDVGKFDHNERLVGYFCRLSYLEMFAFAIEK